MAAPAVEATAATALRSVILRARKAAEHVGRDPERIRVVAVSKTKPVSLIRQLYDAGHRCFAENYVQEFIDKAPQVPIIHRTILSLDFYFKIRMVYPLITSYYVSLLQLPEDIEWHFVGHLQSNKAKALLGVCDFIPISNNEN